MSMSVREVMAWLHALDPDSQIVIDDSCVALKVADDSPDVGAYLEIRLSGSDDEDPDLERWLAEREASMARYYAAFPERNPTMWPVGP